jgi:hypothetical protein
MRITALDLQPHSARRPGTIIHPLSRASGY